jgi:NADPH:quinone reductase-like Zn-dependent oxidoreductase
MKAIRIHAYGGPEQLRYEDVPRPQPKGGEVLVRVHATSVNPFDLKLASGMFRESMKLELPYTPGSDFAGLVESIGPGAATELKQGDAVYGNCPRGACAEFVAAPAETVARKPKSQTEVAAAAAPVAAQTAYEGLFEHGKLERGQSVLIHAAAGGVGSYAVQLAHWKGAVVFATASADNAEFVRSLGADHVIDYKTTPFESVAKNIDVVLDLLGGETQARSFAVLKPGGYLISTVQPPPQDQAAKRNVHATMFGMKATVARLNQLAELFDSGTLRSVVTKTFPLDRAVDGWTLSRSGHARGKIVLEVPSRE